MTRLALALTAVLLAQPAALAQAPAAAGPGEASTAWPQTATVDGTTYVMNAPAYTAIAGNTVSMKTTVQVKPAQGTPVQASVGLTAAIAPASEPGYVELSGFEIETCDAPGGQADAIRTALAGLMKGMGIEATLTTIVQDVAVDSSRDVKGLANPVPAIVVTDRPTVLVSVNGQPALGGCGGGGWKRAVNTPSVLLHAPDGSWWTRVGGQHWLTAKRLQDALQPTQSSPPADVVASLGKVSPPAGAGAPANVAPAKAVPQAIVATVPTLLLSVDGAPAMQPACDGVEWATNCEGVLLRASDAWWTLGSGRWFTTRSLQRGPWTFVPAPQVPKSFANLPAQGPLAAARASVPGTLEARSAAVASSMVRTVTVQRQGARCSVKYRGSPEFAPIAGDLSFSTNASQPVVRAGSIFYCCDDGAWFAAPNATGPWSVTDAVPASVYAIPPSCPVYACTYVEVCENTPETVTFGATPGYLGTYMQDGTPVHGTGHDYDAAHPQAIDPAQADVASYVAPGYPETYGDQATYSYDTGTYAPEQGYGYCYADMYPSVYAYGYPAWGWSPYWGSAYCYGCGWGYGWGYGGWDNWNRNWDRANERAAWNHWDNNHGLADGRGVGAPGAGARGAGAPGTGPRGAGAPGTRGAGAPGTRGAGGAGAGGWGSTARNGNAPGTRTAAGAGSTQRGGYRSPQGYHQPSGSGGVSGFQRAQSGGYRSGGSRGGSAGGRGGGRR
jgi:hypothetical protein